MIRRALLALPILVGTSCAYASWDAGVGLESYRWTEYAAGTAGNPKESGPRSALFVDWTQDDDQGMLFAWRNKLYAGTVNYDTFLITTGEPVSTQTDYTGAATEGQAFYRDSLGGYDMDYLVGLGLDYWRRAIRSTGGDQVETYSVAFLRAGLRLAASGRKPGLHGEVGVKYPAWVREDAHLGSLGYTSNPTISPNGQVSGYAELGYRINARFDVIGYYDSWRFGRSPDVTANKPSDPPGAYWLIHQPESRMDALGVKVLYSF